MKYVLMFFVCGYSTHGQSAGQCAWREAVTFNSRAECKDVLVGWNSYFKWGQDRYILASCFPKTPSVEK